MEEKHKKVLGYAVVGTFGTVAVALMAGSIPFVMPAFRRICLPFVPATDNQVRNVLSLLGKRKGNVIDLGSGDGRIVIAAAKMGFSAVGVELNPWLVLYSKIKALSLGLSDKASFKRQDIWKTDLKNYDNVVIFGVEQMMAQLEEKLSQELKKDGCVIACRFPLPNWGESTSVGNGIDAVWLYEMQENKKLNPQTSSQLEEVETKNEDSNNLIIAENNTIERKQVIEKEAIVSYLQNNHQNGEFENKKAHIVKYYKDLQLKAENWGLSYPLPDVENLVKILNARFDISVATSSASCLKSALTDVSTSPANKNIAEQRKFIIKKKSTKQNNQ